MLNNTKLRHFWAQIVSWAPRHARKMVIVLAHGLHACMQHSKWGLTIALSLSSVPWSIRPLTTHDVFIFKVRFLAASHMVRGDVSPVFSITWLRKRSLFPPLALFPWTLPARMRSSSSPFRMMWPVKRVCLSLMVLRSWRSCPIRWSTEILVSCAVYETRSIRR